MGLATAFGTAGGWWIQRTRSRQTKMELFFQNAQDSSFVIDVSFQNRDQQNRDQVEPAGREQSLTFVLSNVNRAYERSTGFESKDIEGKPIRDIFGRDASEMRERYLQCIEEEGPISYEEELTVNGKQTFWQTRITPIFENGSAKQIVGTTRNITDQKKRKRRLKRQNDLFQRAQDMADIGAWTYDPDTRTGTWTDKTSGIIGIDWLDEASPSTVLKAVHPDDRKRLLHARRQSVETGEEFTIDVRIHPFGTEGLSLCPVQKVGSQKDRKRLEAEGLSSVETVFALEEAPNQYNGQNRSPGGAADAGNSVSSQSGLGGPDNPVSDELAHRSSLFGSSSYRWAQVHGEPKEQPSGNGSPVIHGTIKDITHRKRREKKLRKTKNYYKQILSKVVADLALFSPDAIFRFVNWQAVGDEEMRNWLIGRTNADYCKRKGLPLEIGRRRDQAIRSAANRKETVQFEEEISVNGETKHYIRTHKPILSEDDSVKSVAAFGIDITGRKRRENALKERQRKIEALYDATRKVLASETLEKVSKRIHVLLDNVFDYDFRTIGLLEEDTIYPFSSHCSKGVEVSCDRPLPIGGDTLIAKSLRQERTSKSANLSESSDSTDYGDLEALASIPIGSRGVIAVGKKAAEEFSSFNVRLIEILGTYTDLILQRLQREEDLRKAKQTAEKARDAKSAMLANMSHEIRTPLTSIIGFAELLGEGSVEANSQYPELIEKNGKRLLETLDGILNLSKLESEQTGLETARVDIGEIATQTAEEMKADAKDKGLDVSVEATETIALADPGALQVVVQNLISNAIKYTEEGKIAVRTSVPEDSENEVSLVVEDTGIGMKEEVIDTLFEPFRQESEGFERHYEGTGIGLAVTGKAVSQMNGRIEVQSTKGEGSRFEVLLPKPGASCQLGASQRNGRRTSA